MAQLFVLFEHATGYALFKVKQFEEVGMLLPQIEASVTDLSRFHSIVSVVGFSPFKTAVKALENINNVSEGVLTEDLSLFLDTFLPKDKKVTLGVADPKLGASITETLGTTCNHTGAVPELTRGIRQHFASLVRGLTAKSSDTAQLGLGHSYSRAKVKFNVHRVDNMIIQSIALLDQLDKDVNTFSMRIREWYSYHFPELVRIVPDNYLYAKVARFVKDRKSLSEDSLEGLEELVMDSGKAQAILDASRSSMGMDISIIDLLNIEMFASRVVGLADYRRQMAGYLHTKMGDVAPNLATLIGDQVGARLIAHAGSLTNLAKCPASTVQILGAEKALFRALRTRGNTPKYGLLFHSTFIGRANVKNKGRISRFLANKCSIASRIDCFTDEPTTIFGERLKQQVEDRLTFYDKGVIPAKNIDVMKEAVQEVALERKKNKKRWSKVRKSEEALDKSGVNVGVENSDETPRKKKRCKSETLDKNVGVKNENKETPRKKKRKSETLNENVEVKNGDEIPRKKKHCKSENLDEKVVVKNGDEIPRKKKRCKSENLDKNVVVKNENKETPKKKKKKDKKSRKSV